MALTQVIARYRNRYFKLKLCGDVEADIARLTQIAAVLDPLGRLSRHARRQRAVRRCRRRRATSSDALVREPRLARLRDATLYLEQPLARSIALDTGVHAVARRMPLIIDESDATIDAFVRARALGYAGVSSKTCKGVYKSLLNAARCARWNAAGDGAPAFMTGEDLTAQAGTCRAAGSRARRRCSAFRTSSATAIITSPASRASTRRSASSRRFSPRIRTCTSAPATRCALAIRDGEIALASLAVARLRIRPHGPTSSRMQPIGETGPERIHSVSEV